MNVLLVIPLIVIMLMTLFVLLITMMIMCLNLSKTSTTNCRLISCMSCAAAELFAELGCILPGATY